MAEKKKKRRDAAAETKKRQAGNRNRRRRYRGRERTDSRDTGRDFRTDENTFAEDGTFEKEKRTTPGTKKSGRLQKKAEKAGEKAAAAKNRLPKKTVFSVERVFDEKTGRTGHVLALRKTEKLGIIE